MTITARLASDPTQFARFTWNDDLTECDFIALGPVPNSQDTLDTLIQNKVHEGADLDGWIVTVDWN